DDTTWDFNFGTTTDIDRLSLADVILHCEFSADSGGADTFDVPTTLPCLLDLPSVAPVEWTALVATDAHACTIPYAALLPTPLKSASATAIAKTWFVDVNGKTGANGIDYASKIVVTLDSANRTLTLSRAAGATLPWDQLRLGSVVLTMQPGA